MAGTRINDGQRLYGAGTAELQRTLWIPSGGLTVSTLVSDESCIYGGMTVMATDIGGDIIVRVWDSANENSTEDDDILIDEVTVVDTKVSATDLHVGLTPGVECRKGIWVEIATGNAEVIIYYR